jgi:hypothetical protein
MILDRLEVKGKIDIARDVKRCFYIYCIARSLLQQESGNNDVSNRMRERQKFNRETKSSKEKQEP